MRGLETRVLLARARVRQLTAPGEAQFMLAEAMIKAQAEGWDDAGLGVYDPPLLFADDALLLHWWDCGQHYHAARHSDSADCVFCNDGTGWPCCYHD